MIFGAALWRLQVLRASGKMQVPAQTKKAALKVFNLPAQPF